MPARERRREASRTRSRAARSFRPPWGHPRYPARDGGAERIVLSPKRSLERGFFVRNDEDVEGEPQQRAVNDEAPIAHQHRLTQDDGNDRDVYWIAYITVETGHHEIPGRRDGAGVPRPCSAKRANASTSPGTPARIIIAPMPRVSSRPRNGGRSCQSVIDHGTSPASVHGATTKKTAEPRTATVRCTAVPDTRCRLIPTSPSGATRSPCCPKSGNRARPKPECHGGSEASSTSSEKVDSRRSVGPIKPITSVIAILVLISNHLLSA